MKRKRRTNALREDEQDAARSAAPQVPPPASEAATAIADRTGPALRLAGADDRTPVDDIPNAPPPAAEGVPSEQAAAPPALALRAPAGEETHRTVFANGQHVRLQGRTDATFDGGTSSISGQRTSRAEGCENCTEGCLRVRGTLVLTFSVATQVTLPGVGDFPDLTPCQQVRVRDAIDNVLAPHEQQHVDAFRTYNGTSRHPFGLKGCNAEEINAQLEVIHHQEAASREAAAQALSDALDPFHFDVDLDCEEPEAEPVPTAPADQAGDADDAEDDKETTP